MLTINSAAVPIPASPGRRWAESHQVLGGLQVWISSKGGQFVELEIWAKKTTEVTLGLPVGLVADRWPRKPFVIPAKRCWTTRLRTPSPPVPDWVLPGLFGPANMKLPAIDPAPLKQRYSMLLSTLRQGTFTCDEDVEDGFVPMVNQNGQPWGPGSFGAFRPFGPIDPGAPGGSSIEFMRGWKQVPDYIRFCELASLYVMDRAELYYDSTGYPYTVERYAAPSPDFSPGSGDPNNGELPEFKPTSRDALPLPYDFAHHIRQFAYLIVVYEATHSPLARRQILALAERARLSFSEQGRVEQKPDYTPTNLANYLDMAKGKGIQGTFMGRQAGWIAWLMAEAIKIEATLGRLAWAGAFLLLCDRAAMPTGAIQRHNAWGAPNRDHMQTFEAGILIHGAVALATQLGRPVPAWCLRLMSGLLALPKVKLGSQWSLPHYLEVAVHGGEPLPVLVPASDEPDPATGHIEATLALLYAKTGDVKWRDAALGYGYPALSAMDKKKQPVTAWTSELQGVL